MKYFDLLRQFLPFIKYCIVGALGTFLDLATVYFLVEFFALNPLYAAVAGFLLAVINNFILNKSWTFKNTSTNYRKLWIKFLLVSLGGLVITLGLMAFLIEILGVYYLLAKAMTSIFVLLWNFFANKYWTFRTHEQFIHLPENYKYEYSIVIPAFNEAERIEKTLHKIAQFIEQNTLKAEIIVVNDGSSDTTAEIVYDKEDEITNLTLVNNRENNGKGFAVMTGIEASRGKYILMTDADNSTPIEELLELSKHIDRNEVVIGSRYLPHSQVHISQPKHRVMMGRMGNVLIRLFLLENIFDTQCGFKLFQHHAAKEIFARQKVMRFAFDIEALTIAKGLDYSIAEVPVSWFNCENSRVRPIRDAFRTLIDIAYIKMNLWSGRYK
jgi:dolichyl-phosphate beta-glucosyltransferase